MGRTLALGLALATATALTAPAGGQEKSGKDKPAKALKLSDVTVEAAKESPPAVTLTFRIDGGEGSQDIWFGLGNPATMKKFAELSKGPLDKRLGLLDLS